MAILKSKDWYSFKEGAYVGAIMGISFMQVVHAVVWLIGHYTN